MRKAFCVLLAVALLSTIAVPAFASQIEGRVTEQTARPSTIAGSTKRDGPGRSLVDRRDATKTSNSVGSADRNYARQAAGSVARQTSEEVEDEATKLKYTVTDDQATVTGIGSSVAASIVVPPELGGAPVVAIGPEAFYRSLELERVTIPKSVKEIGDRAFSHCGNLESITFGEGSELSRIGTETFGRCTMTSFACPASVTEIGAMAFMNCPNLSSFTWPSGLNVIGDRAFMGCWDLTDVTLPQGTYSVGAEAFMGTGLKSVDITGTAEDIGDGAWNECNQLTSITISGHVENLGDAIAEDCARLESLVISGTVDSPLKWSGSGRNLKTLQITGTVKDIADGAFDGQQSLETASLTGMVCTIGARAFRDCRNLTSITLSNDVTTIGEEAFSFCDSLPSIEFPESLTTIGTEAFGTCTSLVLLKFSEGLTTIDRWAFERCASLTSLELPASLESVSEQAFVNCSELTTVTVNSSSCEFDPKCVHGL